MMIGTFVLVIVFLPVYGALSFYYSSYTYAYAWTISAAYLTGVNAAVVVCLMLISIALLLLMNQWMIRWRLQEPHTSTTTSTTTLQEVVLKVEEECAMTGRCIYESLLSLPLLILLVWSLFLVDMAGDVTGFFQAIWIVFVLGIVGFVWNYLNRTLLLINTSRIREVREEEEKEKKKKQEGGSYYEEGIELRETTVITNNISNRRSNSYGHSRSEEVVIDSPLHVEVV